MEFLMALFVFPILSFIFGIIVNGHDKILINGHEKPTQMAIK